MKFTVQCPILNSVCFLAGLIDSSVEQMKQIYSQLLLESVQPGKASHRKKVSRDWLDISSLIVSLLPLFFPLHRITIWNQLEWVFFQTNILNICPILSSPSCCCSDSVKRPCFQHIALCFVFLQHQEEGYLKDVKLTVEILRNALYRSDECKVSLCICRYVLHR